MPSLPRFSALALSLAAVLSLSACAFTITAPETDGDGLAGSVHLRGPGGWGRFECVSSPTGACHYLLYTTRCEVAEAPGGQPVTNCTRRAFDAFTLAQGESREHSDLPSVYRHCVQVKGQPELAHCGKA